MKKKLLVSAFATLLALGCAEVLIRVCIGSQLRSIYTLDDACLHRLVPGSSHLAIRTESNGGTGVWIEIDEDGCRRTGPSAADRGERIVVFGDSFILAEAIETERTFCARFREHLATAMGSGGDGTTFDVVNAGVSGYGPDQELVRIEEELELRRPRLIVLAIYAGNDYGDLLRNKIFHLGEHGELVANRHEFDGVLRREFDQALHPSYLWRLWIQRRQTAGFATAWHPSRRATPEQFVEVSLLQNADEFRDFVMDRDHRVHNLLGDHYDADVACEPDSESARYKVRLMRAVVHRIAAAASASGVPLVIVLIPSAIDACDGYAAGSVDVTRHPAYVRDRLTSTLAAIVRECGADCIDLFEPFRERGAEVYLSPPDAHWNEAGHDLAASIVGQYVAARRLLVDDASAKRDAR